MQFPEEPTFHFSGEYGSLYGSLITADGNTLIVGGTQQNLYFFDLREGRLIKEFPLKSTCCRIRATQSSERILICLWEGNLVLWDIEEDRAIRTLKVGIRCWDVSLGNKGEQFVISNYGERILKLYDFENFHELKSISLASEGGYLRDVKYLDQEEKRKQWLQFMMGIVQPSYGIFPPIHIKQLDQQSIPGLHL